MKKISYSLAALALLAAIGFKIAADLPQKPTYFTLGRPTPTAVVSPADAAANGICRGTMQLAWFAPDMGVTQEDLDYYAQRYTDAAKTCDEVTYLGQVVNPDGSIDYLYRIVTAGRQNWYAFTVSEGLIEAIQ